MKAATIRQFGGFDVLKIEEIDTPKPRAGHVLVKILAAGINRLDHYLREGSVVPELFFPHVLGADAAGEVSEIGKGVTGFTVGERVIPVPGFPVKTDEYHISPSATAPSFTLQGIGIPGTYAQYIEVPAAFLVKDKTGLTPGEAATLPVALGTAVRALREVGGVKPNDRVLIHAGASGAGSMQIQVARALGAKIAVTIRSKGKEKFVRSLGADLVINTLKEDFVEKVMEWTEGRGADVVIDSLGGDVLKKSIDAVKATGVVVAFGFTAGTEVTFDIRNFFFGQKQLRGTMASDRSDLEWGLQKVRDGVIRPALDRELPLRDASKAHRLVAENKIAGSIVLLPWAA